MLLLLWILLNSVSDSTCSLIKMDTMHSQEGIFTIRILQKKLKNLIPFRSVFVWRINYDILCRDSQLKRIWIKVWRKCFEIMCPPQKTIEIYVENGNLGGDFYLTHRYCVINAQSIGEHVTVLQGVTIGKDKTGKPSIGDNVIIYPNAVIAGGIHIGNNVVIGANAFVNFDVPDNSTVRAPKATFTEYRHVEEHGN